MWQLVEDLRVLMKNLSLYSPHFLQIMINLLERYRDSCNHMYRGIIAYISLFVDTKVYTLFLFRFPRILPKKQFTQYIYPGACVWYIHYNYRTKISRFCRSGLTYTKKLDCENVVQYYELKLEEEMHTTNHHDTV